MAPPAPSPPPPLADTLLRRLVGPLVFLVVGSGARPDLAGVYGDDAIYLGSAEGLAAGLGPVVAALPGSPAITKYPPLYPWLLAGLDRIGLDLGAPTGVAVVMGLSALAWAVAVHHLVNHLLPRWGADPLERGLVALACAADTVVIHTVPTAMTEGLYTLLLMLQLGATGPAAAILAASAGSLRSAALVLQGALLDRARAAWILGGSAVAVGVTRLARADGPEAPAFLAWFTDYGVHTAYYADAWAAGGVAACLARVQAVVGVNLDLGARSLGELVLPLQMGGGTGDPRVYGYVAWVLAAVGLARRAPRLLPLLGVQTALFLVWTWPFAPRFWLPVFPVVVAGIVWGLTGVPRVGRLLAPPVVGLFVVLNLVAPVNNLLARVGGGEVGEADRRLQALEDWLDAALGPGDVVVGGSESLWLARRHDFQAVPLRTLLPPGQILEAALGLATAPGDLGPGLAALRASTDGEVRVVLPEGAAPPPGVSRALPVCPPGYAAWRVE